MMCGLLAFEVFLAEKVVDSLDGVEGGQRHFDEDGGPVSHGTVPKAGEFLRFECGGSFGLFADESGLKHRTAPAEQSAGRSELPAQFKKILLIVH